MFSWFWQWKKLKIGQYLTKLRRTKQSVPVFVGHPVHVCTVSDYFRITSYNDKLVRGPMFCVAVYSAYKSCLWFGYSMSPKVNHYIITIKSYLTLTPATGGGRGNLPQNGFAESDLIFSGIWELFFCYIVVEYLGFGATEGIIISTFGFLLQVKSEPKVIIIIIIIFLY